MAGGGGGDHAEVFAGAGQDDEDGGVDGADVVALVGGHGGFVRVAEHDGVNLVGIVFVVFVIVVPVCCGGTVVLRRVVGGETCVLAGEGVANPKEGTRGEEDCEEDDFGAEGLTGGEIEAGSDVAAQDRRGSASAVWLACCEGCEYGAPGRIRTSDPLVRSQMLYPAELRAHIAHDLCACNLSRITRMGG